MRYMIPLQENGRMILPSDLRQTLGLKKGDKVILDTHDDRIELTTPRRERKRAQEMFRKFVPPGQDLADQIIAERRQEALEEEKAIGLETSTRDKKR